MFETCMSTGLFAKLLNDLLGVVPDLASRMTLNGDNTILSLPDRVLVYAHVNFNGADLMCLFQPIAS
jgi:hypothetical protein